ncbi:amine oxidase [copper-containing] gamma 1 [Beta vulgaris subsp. vulgaris]|uniref:amine oxidase [copper-containing] gamma 1 n=1 Tax=Beta vulgaris subsp. vulgaris TaxID=3555 RepID=UPI002036CB4F|nr:amine oxidase [copper-containing] gamma 1 [Beta vulgaris subsp. vulgaris]
MEKHNYYLVVLSLLLAILQRSIISKAQTNNHTTTVPRHPLDPVTAEEINQARTILSSYAANKALTIYSLTLDEPPKSKVLSWRQGDPLSPRKISVIARFGGGPIRLLTVDLRLRRVRRVENEPPSGYPIPTSDEIMASMSAPFTSVEFNKSIIKRGVDLGDVNCEPFAPGWFGKKEEKRRIIKVQCFSTKDTINFYMKPIEGLTVVVDLDTNQVVGISESDHANRIPIPKGIDSDYRFSVQKNTHKKIKPINPISMEQPKGPSFTVENNHLIKWGNWEFHLKHDPRAGLTVSRAMFEDPDNGELRSVMYKGMVSELFVPYMDPTEAWYFKTYIDVGDYGLGLSTRSLEPLNDCPRNAYYMDAVLSTTHGKPFVRSNVICIFERYAGDIAWRHTETGIAGQQFREVRPKVTLVARMVPTIGNYDYIIDWIFQGDGVIKTEVALSGIPVIKGTIYKNTKEVPEEKYLYGPLVSENSIGVIHDHYVAFYLDMDVDSPDNSFVKVDIRRQETSPGESPRKSYLKATRNVAKTEKDAQIKLNIYQPSEYHVINPNKKTRVGNPVGYRLIPGSNAASLLDLEDPPQKRAAFTNNQIWVTPYNKSEMWAGGLFVWQSHGDDTLATWTKRDRAIENKDIVVWYVVGLHHIPCQEDFPIMPSESVGFRLKPVNFLSQNPILGIPPYFPNDLPVCQANEHT